MLDELKADLQALANPEKAKILLRFFKTGPGEYGEGDVFIGVKVPEQRAVAKKYKSLSLKDAESLLNSKIHEHRLTALFILVLKYRKADLQEKKAIYGLYLRNTRNINNWDLVDSSAEHIVGAYLNDKDKSLLYDFARSGDIWKRRIAMLSAYHYIKLGEFEDALKIAGVLLKDKHDLIHKAVGWMLREIGNRDLAAEEAFLKKHYRIMPRTMLRYAIEKFDQKKKQFYMQK